MKTRNSIPILIILHWILQGIFHREKGEKILRLLFESTTIIVLCAIFSFFLGIYVALLLSIFLAHSIFFVCDSYIWSVLRVKKLSSPEVQEHLKQIQNRARNKKYLKAVAIFGSLSRLRSNEFSDVDLKIIPQEGILNLILSYFFALNERLKSFVNGFPLDLFILDDMTSLNKLRNEDLFSPIILYDPYNSVKKKFPQSISLNEMVSAHRRVSMTRF